MRERSVRMEADEEKMDSGHEEILSEGGRIELTMR